MKKLLSLAAAALFIAGSANAQTVTRTFNTTGSTTAVNGTAGNAVTFAAANDATLQMKVTGWQANQSTNAINSAFLGAYSGGLGVTGTGDLSGANGLHQIDNLGGYTDFLLLQFSRAVTLSGLNLNLYQITGVSGKDSDFSFWNANVLPASPWNASFNLGAYTAVPSIWTEVASGSADGMRSITASGASNFWLVGASFMPATDRDDGFKVAQLTVTEQVAAVPEPATWAMMLLGFAGVGVAVRRSRKSEDAALRTA